MKGIRDTTYLFDKWFYIRKSDIDTEKHCNELLNKKRSFAPRGITNSLFPFSIASSAFSSCSLGRPAQHFNTVTK